MKTMSSVWTLPDLTPWGRQKTREDSAGRKPRPMNGGDFMASTPIIAEDAVNFYLSVFRSSKVTLKTA